MRRLATLKSSGQASKLESQENSLNPKAVWKKNSFFFRGL
jgi:hypothetical protein